MKPETRRPGLPIALAALLGALLVTTTVLAWAGPDDTTLTGAAVAAAEAETEVSAQAETDDSEHRVVRKVFIDEDGESHEVSGPHVWVMKGDDLEALRELEGLEGLEALEKLRDLQGLEGLEGLPDLEELRSHMAVAGPGSRVRVHRFGDGRPWPRRGALLGIEMTPMSPELRLHFGAPEDRGTMISRVVEGSAAEDAGLRVGDIVTDIDGDAVDSPAAMAMAVGRHEADDVVRIDIVRDGVPQTMTATLRKWEGDFDHAGGPAQVRKVVVICKDGEDCDMAKDLDAPCGDAEDCRIEVECNGGDCNCTVNGDSVDCEQIPGH